jgi:putative Holliday junction resolvase
VRILAIDPGTKYIGLAVSDPTETVANPLTKIAHHSYKEDASFINEIAKKEKIGTIVIGQSINDDGDPTYSGRISFRLGEAIRAETDIPIVFWDEAFTTHDARAARILMQTTRKKRSGHLDSMAAVVLLQSYIDRNE